MQTPIGNCCHKISAPTGATGTSEIGFLYVYNIDDTVVPAGSPVPFNQPEVNLTSGMSFNAPSTINITLAGRYSVNYTIVAQEAVSTLALFLNGVEIPGTRYASDMAPASIVSTMAFAVTQAQLPAALTLVNVHPTVTLTLNDQPLANTVNASIEIVEVIV